MPDPEQPTPMAIIGMEFKTVGGANRRRVAPTGAAGHHTFVANKAALSL